MTKSPANMENGGGKVVEVDGKTYSKSSGPVILEDENPPDNPPRRRRSRHRHRRRHSRSRPGSRSPDIIDSRWQPAPPPGSDARSGRKCSPSRSDVYRYQKNEATSSGLPSTTPISRDLPKLSSFILGQEEEHFNDMQAQGSYDSDGGLSPPSIEQDDEFIKYMQAQELHGSHVQSGPFSQAEPRSRKSATVRTKDSDLPSRSSAVTPTSLNRRDRKRGDASSSHSSSATVTSASREEGRSNASSSRGSSGTVTSASRNDRRRYAPSSHSSSATPQAPSTIASSSQASSVGSDDDIGPSDSASQDGSKTKNRRSQSGSISGSSFESGLRRAESGYGGLVSRARGPPSALSRQHEEPRSRRHDTTASITSKSDVLTRSSDGRSSVSASTNASKRSSIRTADGPASNASLGTSASGYSRAPSGASTAASRRDPVVETAGKYDDRMNSPAVSGVSSNSRRHRTSHRDSSDDSDNEEETSRSGRRRGRGRESLEGRRD
ncbi:hypothetical protein ACMFMG_002278 [Clarireedia jacksonii]